MNIYSKLLEVQAEIKPIVKDSTNPHFKNKYFDINTLLETVKPILNSHGLLLMQALTNINGTMALKTSIVYVPEEGDWEEVEEVTPIPPCADPQKYGSAITYFRRYALQSLLALESEDDDGQVASNKSEPINKTNNFSL